MAISNWLTRAEWNACYFAGFKALVDKGARQLDLGEQLVAGIAELHNAGYKFKGITSHANGDFEKVTQCCEGNESVLAEIVDGSFDALARAKEVLAWTDCPTISFKWLAEEVAHADQPKEPPCPNKAES